ncbi:hypothetical protein LTR99_004571 [Exophiala xenobiotica]|uniref:Gamma interferon inducible lysosomal thiol reductase n=1 Tax=Vermiconidia calcicola TaxID=1690605 RepID=A0AAV9QBQ2_9PEZI|nr:hypothetical protein LTR92_000317 [Exophiala xenobiotica]KAK5539851.1 hypothetical protein LTR25_003556 [Vermiconidia calcicola]KAK5547029.1 hypothetical protein LTR23_003032 [Chaetothyriales sp. CCFEE 6169]KAK5210943.1 hypothetical protein LTR41_003555 [Exophiala xenobiotica]KAK5224727.1 hypothetical protein LTR72_004508 [Exophiala xenobiotica]
MALRYASSPDEKVRFSDPPTILPYGEPRRALHPLRERWIKRILPAILTLLALFALFRTTFVCNHRYDPGKPMNVLEETEKVPLEIHVMSKCPDARDCLQELILPTMVEVSDKVNFTMSFIGSPRSPAFSIDPDSDAVTCKHGPGECLGNIILLCAAKVYQDVKIWLGFTNCMMSDYPDIPKRDLVESCAMEHGIDFAKLNTCISDEGEGIGLLRSSIQRSAENNVTRSCTVRLAGQVRCVRDGGEWYDCPGGSSVQDLVGDVDELYSKGSI